MKLADKLLDICKQNEVEESLRTSKDWEVLYHLSPMRKNLLEWYTFRKDAALLEVGAQAGAMTELFAKCVKKVVSLEKDSDMMTVNQQRNGMYGNVEFRCGDFNQISEDEKYDYITLVGTLEQASQYCLSNQAHVELLRECEKHLKEDGILIIAFNNKMSMSNWAGAPDSATGRPFSGITNDFKEKEARSFSKKQIEHVLKKCNFKQAECYYPTPDFYFATSLFSDEYLPQKSELRPSNLSYRPNGYQFFYEDVAYDTICEEQLYTYFAEAYLMFVTK